MELLKEYFNEDAGEKIKIYKLGENSFRVHVGLITEQYFYDYASAESYAMSVSLLNG